ncbi:MAG TPA: hypothetical protein H9707_06570, partial [Candidatus Butyricicoccus avicola]|nr:hypothetical protein [Candidatus Butyricicoccus avicola]
MKGKRWLAGAVAAAMLLSVAPVYAFADQLDEPAAADESALECTKAADCPAQEHEPDCPAAEVSQTEANAALTRENTEPDTTTPETETTPEPEESGDVKQPGEETSEESEAVCSIDGEEYNTLDEAIEAADNMSQATIILKSNCILSLKTPKHITGDVTINGQGHTVTVQQYGFGISGTLTLDNVKVNMEGITTSYNEGNYPYAAILVHRNGTLKLENQAELRLGNGGRGVHLTTNSTVEVTNNSAIYMDGVVGNAFSNVNRERQNDIIIKNSTV